ARQKLLPSSHSLRAKRTRSSLIGSPRGASVISGDHHCAAEIVSGAATSVTHVAQAQDSSGHRRRVRKSPGLAAIIRSGGARVVRTSRIQITAAYNAMERVTKIATQGTRGGGTHQGSVIRIPGVASVSGGQNPGNI